MLCYSFPPYIFDDTPDADGAQEPDATTDSYYQESPGGHFYWVEPADQE